MFFFVWEMASRIWILQKIVKSLLEKPECRSSHYMQIASSQGSDSAGLALRFCRVSHYLLVPFRERCSSLWMTSSAACCARGQWCHQQSNISLTSWMSKHWNTTTWTRRLSTSGRQTGKWDWNLCFWEDFLVCLAGVYAWYSLRKSYIHRIFYSFVLK